MNFKTKYLSIVVAGGLMAVSCTRHKDSPGYEFVPDMYRSQAIEAYVDYGMVADDEFSDRNKRLKNTISARKPVAGTIPYYENKEMAKLMMPYPFPDTPDGKLLANSNQIPAEMLKDIDGNVKEGKRLYGIFCAHCHGLKGQGDGGVVRVGDYNPPNPYDGGYKDRTPGSLYHTITYGTGGAMGPHASQLNKIERWKVVMYVRTLQHGEFKLEEKPASDSVAVEVK